MVVRQQCSHHNLFGARLPQESVYFAGRLPYKPFERQLLLNRRLFYDDFFSLDSPPRHLGFQRSHCLWRSDQVCTPSPIFYKKSLTTLPRIADTSSEHVARAEMSTPVQPVVARAPIVDMPDNRRRSQLGHITRRLARIVSERDEPLPEAVVARELEPAVESRERRYPRRVYHDFYAREPEPEPVVPVAPVVESRERRYPRQVYHDLYVKREPATSIKETTKVTEKITVLDTPADLAAFNAANAGAKSPFATPSGSGATLSTITSTSQTTTVLASGSIPTPAPLLIPLPLDFHLVMPPPVPRRRLPVPVQATLHPPALPPPALLPAVSQPPLPVGTRRTLHRHHPQPHQLPVANQLTLLLMAHLVNPSPLPPAMGPPLPSPLLDPRIQLHVRTRVTSQRRAVGSTSRHPLHQLSDDWLPVGRLGHLLSGDN